MSKRLRDVELVELGECLLRSKVQCGVCSDAFTLLDVTPAWDYGFFVCEECEKDWENKKVSNG